MAPLAEGIDETAGRGAAPGSDLLHCALPRNFRFADVRTMREPAGAIGPNAPESGVAPISGVNPDPGHMRVTPGEKALRPLPSEGL